MLKQYNTFYLDDDGQEFCKTLFCSFHQALQLERITIALIEYYWQIEIEWLKILFSHAAMSKAVFVLSSKHYHRHQKRVGNKFKELAMLWEVAIINKSVFDKSFMNIYLLGMCRLLQRIYCGKVFNVKEIFTASNSMLPSIKLPQDTNKSILPKHAKSFTEILNFFSVT